MINLFDRVVVYRFNPQKAATDFHTLSALMAASSNSRKNLRNWHKNIIGVGWALPTLQLAFYL
ncbi:MAG: hypothetical protein ACHBN1_24610 [Heteroscytonema crispum UTEX LB 1556]